MALSCLLKTQGSKEHLPYLVIVKNYIVSCTDNLVGRRFVIEK